MDWSSPEKVFDVIGDDTGRTRPSDSIDYHLYYYDSGWQKLATCKSQDGILHLENIPANALLKIEYENEKLTGRPFTIQNGECKFW